MVADVDINRTGLIENLADTPEKAAAIREALKLFDTLEPIRELIQQAVERTTDWSGNTTITVTTVDGDTCYADPNIGHINIDFTQLGEGGDRYNVFDSERPYIKIGELTCDPGPLLAHEIEHLSNKGMYVERRDIWNPDPRSPYYNDDVAERNLIEGSAMAAGNIVREAMGKPPRTIYESPQSTVLRISPSLRAR